MPGGRVTTPSGPTQVPDFLGVAENDGIENGLEFPAGNLKFILYETWAMG